MKQNDNHLPFLDQKTLDRIFNCVYGEGLDEIKDEQLKDFVQMLLYMQGYNYRYRNEMLWKLYPAASQVIEFEINSEGTSLWLALCLAIKELYGMRNSTLQQVLRKVTVRL